MLVRWGAMDADELRARLTRSYLTVRRGLTKRVQAGLGPEPAGGTGQGAPADGPSGAARGRRDGPTRGRPKTSRLA